MRTIVFRVWGRDWRQSAHAIHQLAVRQSHLDLDAHHDREVIGDLGLGPDLLGGTWVRESQVSRLIT
jgi:hypothetical protein